MPTLDSDEHFIDYCGYKVSIRVNGKDLPVYEKNPNPERRHITAWIPSEAGTEFEIVLFQARSLKHTTCVTISVDGKKVSEAVIGQDYDYKDRINGCLISSTMGRRFQFEKLGTTADESYVNEGIDLSALGKIVIQMRRVTVTKLRKKKAVNKYINPIPRRELLVPEASHKAGNHVVQLGREEPVEDTAAFTEVFERLDKRSWATFEFKYRPIARLQADGIIPKLVSDPDAQQAALRVQAELAKVQIELKAICSQLGSTHQVGPEDDFDLIQE
ncbi:hypothetical protein FRC04_008240 [Tulasnella sp. 424]|nr:hypothetical protein FRC04_008240 [Tulasnella sp. 424]KAG8960434.1 hypothetical protein FRC05_006848 [Tulasnella sp. 425]